MQVMHYLCSSSCIFNSSVVHVLHVDLPCPGERWYRGHPHANCRVDGPLWLTRKILTNFPVLTDNNWNRYSQYTHVLAFGHDRWIMKNIENSYPHVEIIS